MGIRKLNNVNELMKKESNFYRLLVQFRQSLIENALK